MRAMHHAEAMHHARHSKGLFVIIFCMCASMSIMKEGQRWEPHYEEVGGSSGVAKWLKNRIVKCMAMKNPAFTIGAVFLPRE